MRCLRSAGFERGAVMVEFVISIPVLLMLLMVTAEFGRAFLQYNVLTKSVRDAGRYVASTAFQGSTGAIVLDPTLRSEAANLVVYGNVQGSGSPLLPGQVVADTTLATAGPGDFVISSNYAYRPIFANLSMLGFGSAITPNYRFQVQLNMRAL